MRSKAMSGSRWRDEAMLRFLDYLVSIDGNGEWGIDKLCAAIWPILKVFLITGGAVYWFLILTGRLG
jgi:hypothetical protein